MTELRDPFESSKGEIDLVALARIGVQRRVLFLTMFLAFLMAGLAVAFLKPVNYRFTSLYQIGQTDNSSYLQAPTSAVAIVINRLIPAFQENYLTSNNRQALFSLSASNPEATGLLVLVSEGRLSDGAQIKKAHQEVLNGLAEIHTTQYAERQDRLTKQLKGLNDTIEELGNSRGTENGAALAGAYEKRTETEASLSTIKKSEIVTLSRRSAEPTSVSALILMVLAFIVALVFAMLAVFVAEFCSRVRREL